MKKPKQVKALREEYGLTRLQLGALVGRKLRIVQAWECKDDPRNMPDNMYLLAEMLLKNKRKGKKRE